MQTPSPTRFWLQRKTIRGDDPIRALLAFLHHGAYLARPCSVSVQTQAICASPPLMWPHLRDYSRSEAICDQNDCLRLTATVFSPGTTTISRSCGGRPIPGPYSFPT